MIEYSDIVNATLEYVKDMLMDSISPTDHSITDVMKAFQDRDSMKNAIEKGNAAILLMPIFTDIERLDMDHIPYVVVIYRNNEVYVMLTSEEVWY